MNDKKIHVFRCIVPMRFEDIEIMKRFIDDQLPTGTVVLPYKLEYLGTVSPDDEIKIIKKEDVSNLDTGQGGTQNQK